MSPRRYRRLLMSAGPWIALGLHVGCGGLTPSSTGRRSESVPVEVATAVRKTMPVILQAVGNVEASSRVEVRSRVGGEMARVHFEEGQEVRKGDLLFEIDPAPYEAALEAAEARLARDRALSSKADEDVKRYEGLVRLDYVTREQYDQVRATAEALRATIRANEASVTQARLELGYCTIRAPIGGRTGDLLVHAGNVVKANDERGMVVILQTRPILVRFSVPEKYLPQIRARAQVGPLTVSASARDEASGGHEGRLDFVDNTVDAATGTIRLKAVFPNADGALWPGQFVEVKLTLSEEANVIVVPSHAVQASQQGTFVFVVKSDGTAESRMVDVVRSVGEETVLGSGVAVGERVVTDGHLRVVPGARVEVKNASTGEGPRGAL